MSISYDISKYESFNDLIEALEKNAIFFKGELLKLDDELEMSSSTNKVNYSNLMVLWTLSKELVLFPDEEILNKFKKLGLNKATLKWFVKIEEILSEIDRLSRIEGLTFNKLKFLLTIEAHLSISFGVSILEEFLPTIEYKKSHSNKIHKDFVNRFRRMNTLKRKVNIENNIYEDPLDMLMHLAGNLYSDPNEFKDFILKLVKGENLFLEKGLSDFENKGISKSKVYEELFPLFRMVDKKRIFLIESEFNNRNDVIYDGNYRVYKSSMVRKILSKSSRKS